MLTKQIAMACLAFSTSCFISRCEEGGKCIKPPHTKRTLLHLNLSLALLSVRSDGGWNT